MLHALIAFSSFTVVLVAIGAMGFWKVDYLEQWSKNKFKKGNF